MAKNYPYQTTAYGQNPQYRYQQQLQQQPQPQQQVPTFSGGQFPGFVGLPQQPAAPSIPGMLPIEESYIENILRLNKGKMVTVYATFENNPEWNAKIFKGLIEAAGRDHLILSDPQTGMRYLIPMIYLDYATFEEEIEYQYPFSGGFQPLSAYTPR